MKPRIIEHAIRRVMRTFPATLINGPRQAGKTTLLTERFSKTHRFVSIENPDVRTRLMDDPIAFLKANQPPVILDEIQYTPEFLHYIKTAIDENRQPGHWLLSGSQNFALMQGVSQTLAGRVEFVELSGFDIRETDSNSWQHLWLRGRFPRSFLARSDDDSLAWREGFIQTFLERDIPQPGITIPSTAIRRFWTMLAHFHGQLWNASELARSMGLTGKTVRSYLDILSGTFMVRQLQPWHENIGKRQFKAPKIYLMDTGILHALLNIIDTRSLYGYARVGASWEGFALNQF